MRRIIALLVALSCAFALSAQTTVKVQAPNLVALDEQFNVTFVINGENAPSSFEWGAGDDFQLVWGPQKGTSTSVSIVNGQKTKTSQTTFTYVLLPKKTGKFQLPSASATVKGEQLWSGRHSIEVVANGAEARGSQQSQSSDSRGENQVRSTGGISSDDIFLRMSVSKSKAVVGETITATLKLYQRVNIAGFEDARFPTFNGFWSQETFAPQNIEFKRENVGDMIYNSAVLRTWTLIPQQAGDIVIEPSELVCLVNVRAPRTSTGSIFDSFFQDDYQTVRKRVSTQAHTVHVSQVPGGAPASFGGGVGTFKMTASVTRDSLKAHDAASLLVTVSGKGNVALLEAPEIDFPVDFEVYDVKVTETAGSKTFEYPFIPRSHGDFVLGPVEYSYYDISAGKYVTLKSDPMPLAVSRGSESDAQPGSGQLVQGVNRKDVLSLGSDIRHIVTAAPKLHDSGSMFAGSALFWLLTALLCLIAAAAYVVLRKITARRADVTLTRKRAANKMARRRLSVAGDYLGKNLYSAFYEELHKALLGYVSDKLGMDAAEMSKDNISARLHEKGVQDGLVADFVSLLDACEFARYSPNAGHEAMNSHYESAVSVISNMDECMKKTRKPASAVAGVLAIFLAVGAGSVSASASETADSLWTAGVEAYSEGRWNDALQSWTAIGDAGMDASELQYNIGNAYFKSGEVARAILHYERALKADPSNKDARYNLDFANTQVLDKIETVPEFFLKTWMRRASCSMSPNAWAALFLLLLAVSLVMLLLFLLGGTVGLRKGGFFASLAAFICCLFCLAFALSGRSVSTDESHAIVVRPVTSVKSSPARESAVDLFVLHEGTKVTLIDSVGEWVDIELADGRQGWMKASDMEVI